MSSVLVFVIKDELTANSPSLLLVQVKSKDYIFKSMIIIVSWLFDHALKVDLLLLYLLKKDIDAVIMEKMMKVSFPTNAATSDVLEFRKIDNFSLKHNLIFFNSSIAVYAQVLL